jgi:hypothetical protein
MLRPTDDGNSADVSKTKDGSDLAPEPLVGGLDLAMIAGAVLVAIAAIAVYLTLPASASRKIASPLMSNSPAGAKPSRW